jgi:hypothetical protein
MCTGVQTRRDETAAVLFIFYAIYLSPAPVREVWRAGVRYPLDSNGNGTSILRDRRNGGAGQRMPPREIACQDREESTCLSGATMARGYSRRRTGGARGSREYTGAVSGDLSTAGTKQTGIDQTHVSADTYSYMSSGTIPKCTYNNIGAISQTILWYARITEAIDSAYEYGGVNVALHMGHLITSA